jgi:hypothetical protein
MTRIMRLPQQVATLNIISFMLHFYGDHNMFTPTDVQSYSCMCTTLKLSMRLQATSLSSLHSSLFEYPVTGKSNDVKPFAYSYDIIYTWRCGCQPHAPVDRPLTSGRFLVLISVRGRAHPRAIVRLQAMGQFKHPMTCKI